MKVKSGIELKYKKGLAVVLLTINEMASEYDSDSDYEVELHFKSEAAVRRTCKELGYKLPIKNTIDAYKKGKRAFNVYLNSRDLNHIDGQQNIHKEFFFNYKNHYDNTHYFVKINPTNEDMEVPVDAWVGSCANGQSFYSFLNDIKESILKGYYNYYV